MSVGNWLNPVVYKGPTRPGRHLIMKGESKDYDNILCIDVLALLAEEFGDCDCNNCNDDVQHSNNERCDRHCDL